MTVNGRELLLKNKIVLKDFLIQNGYNTKVVAVEKNGKVVSRGHFESETVQNTDKLEIVSFVGGIYPIAGQSMPKPAYLASPYR